MSVTLSPSNQLGFHRPLTQLVKRTLSVTNHNHQPIAYKVKTTAPKQYCVRPNSGRIEPGETVEVQVLLQPMKEDPAPGTKCRDKFLVQSIIVTMDKDSTSLPELWAQVEKQDKSEIHEQKIRCAYLAPIDEASNGTHADTANDTSSTPPASAIHSSSSTQKLDAGDQSFSSTLAPPLDQQHQQSSSASTPSPLASSLTADDDDSATTATAGTVTDSAASLVAGAAAAVGLGSVANAVSSKQASAPEASGRDRATTDASLSDSDAKAQLATARAEIASLRTRLAKAQEANSGGNELRQRTTGASAVSGDNKSASSTDQAVLHKGGAEGGVPPKVVLGITVAAIVITWLYCHK